MRRQRSGVRFYVCLAILVVSAGAMPFLAGVLGRHFRKEALPLKKPLAQFDARQLAPEYGLDQTPVMPLSEEMTAALGTEDYAQLNILDYGRTPDDPLYAAHVFLSYYTGQPDMVPHVPDECMMAAGYDPVGGARTAELLVPGVGAADDRVPVRVLNFRKARQGRISGVESLQDQEVTVMYFFLVNGRFATTRNEVRVIQANPFDRYAYYAKIEIGFSSHDRSRTPGSEESVKALGALLRRFLPVLLADHVPDWQAAEAAAQTGRTQQPARSAE